MDEMIENIEGYRTDLRPQWYKKKAPKTSDNVEDLIKAVTNKLLYDAHNNLKYYKECNNQPIKMS